MSFLDLLKNPSTFKRAVCKVSGISFYDIGDVAEKLVKGMEVRLDPDPGNKHDKLALKVMVDVGSGFKHIGFVPRPLNHDVCTLLLSGVEMNSKIIGVSPPNGGYSYYSVKIEINVVQ